MSVPGRRAVVHEEMEHVQHEELTRVHWWRGPGRPQPVAESIHEKNYFV